MDTRNNGYVRVGVECTAGWPDREQEVEFEGRRLTLCPESDGLAASVLTRLDGTLDHRAALKLVHRFLSAFAWVRRGAVTTTQVVVGTRPVGIGRGRGRMIDNGRLDYLPEPADPKRALVLALSREALSVNSVPYAFLGHFKVINVLHHDGRKQVAWVNAALPNLTDERAVRRLAVVRQLHPDPGQYLYTSGRCAVAHAFSSPLVDPDDPDHLARLHEDLPVVRALAEYAIEHELGVKCLATVLDEHLFELEGFRDLWAGSAPELKAGRAVDPALLNLPLRLSLRLRGEGPFPRLESLSAEIASVSNGVVELRLSAQGVPFGASVLLDFPDERLVFDALTSLTVGNERTAAATEMRRDCLMFLKRWMANGETEVWNPAGGRVLGRSQPAILLNMIPDWGALEREIERLTSELELLGRDQRPG